MEEKGDWRRNKIISSAFNDIEYECESFQMDEESSQRITNLLSTRRCREQSAKECESKFEIY